MRAREDAIVDAQEAKDDFDDAQEKYVAHTEAWERMLEYQKGIHAKRQAERDRVEAERKESAASQKAKEAVEEKEEVVAENGVGQKNIDGTAPPDNNGAGEKKDEQKADTSKDEPAKQASSENNDNERSQAENASGPEEAKKEDKKEEENVPRPLSPLPDPMECMPPRPQPPDPMRVVAIPDIPLPPTPPPVAEGGDDYHSHTSKTKSEGLSESTNDEAVPMTVPKVNKRLVRHLDPTCFLPTMTGRYLGLLSNHISDPQFQGVLAPGIEGNTFGGGTGLATSYAGGGRGAMGLVGGPSKGSLWGAPAHVVRSKSDGGKSSAKKGPAKEKGERTEVKPDEVTSSKAAPKSSEDAEGVSSLKDAAKENADDKTSSSTPAKKPTVTISSASKKKPGASSSTPNKTTITVGGTTMTITTPSVSSSTKKKKKPKRAPAFCLATGDRNTSATEVGAGPAGEDFPDGWIVKTYRRAGGETIGKTDRFWFSPGRCIRFRAKKHAKSFIEILGEPNVDGDEDKAAEIYRARGLHF